MALVEWTEDYGQYKKGDQFVLSNPDSRAYLVETGKIKVIDQNHIPESVSVQVATPEEIQEEAKAITSPKKSR